tara:strand:+ start:161 stop:628 length:468 start_codon:yes stop_codon:yes gene_type:complete
MKDEFNIYLKNIESTKSLALKFSKIISKSILISLDGELGIGKTTFARFLINFLAKKKIKVLSPTFPIVQIYNLSGLKIWHFDFYRIKHRNELFNLDFETALNDLVIVEWSKIAKGLLPKNRIEMFFYEDKDLKKYVKIRSFGNINLKKFSDSEIK